MSAIVAHASQIWAQALKDATTQARLKIRLSGIVRVFKGEREIPIAGMKARALLGFVAYHAPDPVGRDRLCAILWSEKDQDRARASLRQTLKRLQACLAEEAGDLLETTPDEISVRAFVASVDLSEARRNLEAGRTPELLQKSPDGLANIFEGMDHLDPALGSWLAVVRQRWQQDAVNALSRNLLAGRQNADTCCETILRMEPYHEGAIRFRMTQLHESGQSSKALELYAELWQRLDEELDVNPSSETQILAVSIKEACGLAPVTTSLKTDFSTAQGSRTPSPSLIKAPAVCSAERLSLVQVEAFDLTDVDASQRLVFEGLRLEFINALTRFREWVVVDGSNQGKKLVGIRMTGTANRDGENWHLALRLTEAESNQIIWAEQISLVRESLSLAKRRAIRRISLALNIHLTSTRLARTPRSDDLNINENDAWLLGQALLSHWQPESELRAEQLFRQLIRAKENFAPAYVGLAQVLNTRHFIAPGVYRSLEAHREGLRLSLQAISMDPLDSKAHLTLAWSYALNGMWETSVETFLLAYELNENDPWTLVSAALGLAYGAEIDRAVDLSRQMRNLGVGVTPLQWGYLSAVSFLDGDYDEAADAAARAGCVTAFSSAWQVAALTLAGRTEQAGLALEQFYKVARATWGGIVNPNETDIIDWALHAFPFRQEGDWKTFREGLRAAGAPVKQSRRSALQ